MEFPCVQELTESDLSYFAQKGWWERSQWRHQHDLFPEEDPPSCPSVLIRYCLPSLPAEILIQQRRPGLRVLVIGAVKETGHQVPMHQCLRKHPNKFSELSPQRRLPLYSSGKPPDAHCGTFIGLWLSAVVLPNMLVPLLPKPEVVPNRLILALKKKLMEMLRISPFLSYQYHREAIQS